MELAGFEGWQPLWAGDRHLVLRGRRIADGLSVVAKRLRGDFPEPSAVVGLAREAEILGELAGSVRIVECLGLVQQGAVPVLVLKDAGPTDLASLGALPKLREFLAIARGAAEALAEVHERGFVHRDVSPRNLVLGDGTDVTLIDFGMAKRLQLLSPPEGPDDVLRGTLHYVSPEQTGRTGMSVDARSDLYSLGATLYRLLVGRPPFPFDAPAEVLQGHLARQPRPLSQVRLDLPPTVGGVVERLLRKDPAERYQDARSLAADLAELEACVAEGGDVRDVTVGGPRPSRHLRRPQRLHGREMAAGRLTAAFERACNREGVLLFLEGGPGVGKSALGRRLDGLATAAGGWFGTGQASGAGQTPYSALSEALDSAIRGVLSAPPRSRRRAQSTVRSELGSNAAAVATLVPAVAELLGEFRALPPAGPLGARNRLVDGLVALVEAIARPRSPLVLLLDDAHALDAASIRLLTDVAVRTRHCSVLWVAAVRPEELPTDHALHAAVARLEQHGVPVERIALGAIGRRALGALLGEVLGQPDDELGGLVDLVQNRAGSNPLLVLQYVAELVRLRLLTPSPEGWVWDAEGIDEAALPDDSLRLLVSILGTLPEPSLAALGYAATLGRTFDLGLVADLMGSTLVDAADALAPAVARGLLIGGSRPIPPRAGISEEQLALLKPNLRFAHGRVREVARDALPAQRRRRAHLDVAARLAERRGEAGLFEVVEQRVLAGDALQGSEARRAAAEDALKATEQALRAAAPAAALRYARAGIGWLDGWSESSQLAQALHVSAAWASAATGDPQAGLALLAEASEHVDDPVEQGRIGAVTVVQHVLAGDHAAAISAGRAAATAMGRPLPGVEELPSALLVAEQEARVALSKRSLDGLMQAPPMKDAGSRALMEVLSALIPSTFFTDQLLFRFGLYRMVTMTLEQGLSPASGYPLTFYGMDLVEAGRHQLARQLGETGLLVARQRGEPDYLCRVLFVWAHHLQHWGGPLRDNEPLLREAVRSALEAGDHQWAGYCETGLILNLLPIGGSLQAMIDECDRVLPFLQRTGNVPMIQMTVGQRQAARWMCGLTRDGLSDDQVNEADLLEQVEAVGSVHALVLVSRVQAAYVAGRFEEAAADAARVRGLLPFLRGLAWVPEHLLYEGLATVRVDPGPASRARLLDNLAHLDSFAAQAPFNFKPKAELLRGELALLDGNPMGAIQAWERAAAGARREGFLADAAIGLERAGRACLAAGLRTPGRSYLSEARQAWHLWGATVRTDALDAEFGWLGESDGVGTTSHSDGTGSHRTASRAGDSGARLDLDGMVAAYEAISSELDRTELVRRVLQIVLELSGATRGVLVRVPGEEGPVVEAELGADGRFRVLEEQLGGCRAVPSALVAEALQHGSVLSIPDVRLHAHWSQDPWLRGNATRSVVCVPARRQRRMVAVVYLENDLAPRAFSGARTRMLALLASQVAVALENADLFDRVRQETTDRLDTERKLQQAQRLESVGRLSSGVAHDFNNLLGVILGWSALLLDELAEDEHPWREALEQMAGAAERGASLTRQLLAFARSSPAHPQAVDVYDRVESLARMLDRVVGDDVKLVLADRRGGVPPALIDPVLLEQVVVNLVVNARDAMPNGGRVDIDVGQSRLTSGAADLAPGEYVVLSVEDTGIGIPIDVLERIFEPFFTTKDPGKGTGLGLSTCLGIAQQSGGTLRASSRADHGTKFELYVPRSHGGRVAPGAGVTSPEVPKPAPAGLRLLLVEDDAMLRELLVMALQRDGFEVVAACSAEDALDLVAEGPEPDLLLTDLTMPGMDGLELIARLRGELPDLPAVLLTGIADTLEETALPQDPPVHLIGKPVRPAALTQTLRSLAADSAAAQ